MRCGKKFCSWPAALKPPSTSLCSRSSSVTTDLALRVCDDDNFIDQFEVEIDEMVILLLDQGSARQLTCGSITVAMKVSQNLERIGDEATKIAKRARELAQEPPVKINFDINRIAGMASTWSRTRSIAFMHRDSAAARAIIPRDKEVDALNKNIHHVLAQHMTENPETISRVCIGLLSRKALNALPTTPRTSPRKSFFFVKPRTSGTL